MDINEAKRIAFSDNGKKSHQSRKEKMGEEAYREDQRRRGLKGGRPKKDPDID